MRTKQSILVILLISIVFSFVNLSCHSVKTAVSCPEISIKKSNYRAHRKVRNSHALFAHKTSFKIQNINRSKKIQNEENKNLNLPVVAADRRIQISKIEFTSGLIASIDNTFHPLIRNTPTLIVSNEEYKYINNQYKTNIQEVKCDTIILKSGAIIIGKVEEIGQSELKYKRCNNLTGPVISVLKSDVSKILYSNGTNELFGPNEIYIPNQTNFYYNSAPIKTEGLGLAGFLSGLVGLFIASIPLGIIAVVFGGISLSKIKKNPQRFKGKGFAIASIILGIVDVVAMIILLSSTQ